MASITLNSADVFPDGTSVSAYQRSADLLEGAPSGSAAATATATNGTVSFTGLVDNTGYVAYAQVSGQDRYRRFYTGVPSSPSGGGGAGLLIGAGAPTAGDGADGQTWLDSDTGDLWGPKTGGAWPAGPVDLTGPQGLPGAGNTSLVLLSSTARTTTQAVVLPTNQYSSAAILTVNVTTMAAGSLSVVLQGTTALGTNYDITPTAPPAITGPGLYRFVVAPGTIENLASFPVKVNDMLPVDGRVVITPADATSITYSCSIQQLGISTPDYTGEKANGFYLLPASMNGSSTAASSLTSGRGYVSRFVPQESVSLTKIAFRVETAASTDQPLEIAIYDDASPPNRLATTGKVSGLLNATGNKTVAIAVALEKGNVYRVEYVQWSPPSAGTGASIRAMSPGFPNALLGPTLYQQVNAPTDPLAATLTGVIDLSGSTIPLLAGRTDP